MLHIYNTSSRQKELFKPINAPKVGLYVCGLTVYDDCHLGHGRLFIWFDVVVRYLRHLGFEVTYVRNITDIDDKIIKRANELIVDYKELTKNTIDSMHADEKKLSVIPPDFEPRVTDNIPQIIALIQALVDKGFAYPAKNGDVYYQVANFTDYGKFSNQDLTSLRSGVRIEASDLKNDPLDFVLWKTVKPNEPYWESPWGNGRPGWHIECSAMAKAYLGDTFDIHGGGNDLQFPHHQNELAQSEAANGCKFANYWMHMGFIQVDQEKMSKSLGNFFTLKEVLKQYHPEILRYLVVASHYRSPINFCQQSLEQAYAALKRFYITLRDLPKLEQNLDAATAAVLSPHGEVNEAQENLDLIIDPANEFNKRFHEAMDDDFNTPEALAVLFDLTREINKLRDSGEVLAAHQYADLLKKLGFILGILQDEPQKFLQAGIDEDKINALIVARNQARQNKDWAQADLIRAQLSAMGITIEDTSSGTKFYI